jgi:hypothetical protein
VVPAMAVFVAFPRSRSFSRILLVAGWLACIPLGALATPIVAVAGCAGAACLALTTGYLLRPGRVATTARTPAGTSG